MRVKPLLLSRNKEISVQSLLLFKECIIILNNKKMEVEKHDINFSTNDPINVTIPDSLGSITFEFYDTFLFILRETAQN